MKKHNAMEPLVERLEALTRQAEDAACKKDWSSVQVLMQEALETTKRFNEQTGGASISAVMKEEFVMANQLEPNKWYFTVDCSKCGEAIPFAEAPSPKEEPELQFRTVKLQCPHCGTEDIYAPALMTRRRPRFSLGPTTMTGRSANSDALSVRASRK